MVEYFPKINTLFKRDKHTFNVIVGDFTRPEFQEHNDWLINEKLDGSNISIAADRDSNGEVTVTWRGRTERAQFHKEAVTHLQQRCDDWYEPLSRILHDNDLDTLEFFGELIGPKIQKGSIYTDVVTTKFYDIRVQKRLWLPWDAVLDYREILGYDVPYHEYGATIGGIVEACREGFETFEDQGTGGTAEGLICKTNIPLYNNANKRLIFKLKHVDFTH